MNKPTLERTLKNLLARYASNPADAIEKHIARELQQEEPAAIVVGTGPSGHRAVWFSHPVHGEITIEHMPRRAAK